MKQILFSLFMFAALCSKAQTMIFPDSIDIVVTKFYNGIILPTQTKKVLTLSKGHSYTTIIIKHPTEDKDYNFEYILSGSVEPPKPPVVTTIDNSHPSLNYSTGWTQDANQLWTSNYHLKTAAYSTTKDNTIGFAFVGTGFELWLEKRINHGGFAVSIDLGPEIFVDTYSPSSASPATPEKVFERLGLTQGTHQVRVRVTGIKNPAAATLPDTLPNGQPNFVKTDISIAIDKIVFFSPSL